MASVTIRQIDELTKQKLRERAARNGVSMEQELRSILQALAEQEDTVASLPVSIPAAAEGSIERATTSPLVATGSAGSLSGRRILLIIGGGIAAYKSLDLVRRLRGTGCLSAHGDERSGAIICHTDECLRFNCRPSFHGPV